MRPLLPPCLGALLVILTGVIPAAPAAAGAWTSHVRPYHYNALLTQGDTVWCATGEAGLLQYLPGRTPDPFLAIRREPGGLASNTLTALAMEATRRLWVGTSGSGASRLSADRTHWDLIKTFDGLPEDSITVLVAQGDSVWIGTTKGIALWNGRTIAGAIPSGVDPSPFANDHITGIVPRGDSLWISTLDGVYVSRISTGFQTWSRVTNGFLTPSIQAMRLAGTTLVALANSAPFYFDDAAAQWNYTPNHDCTANSIGQVVRLSGERGVVIASSDHGLWRWGTCNDWQFLSDAFSSNPLDDRQQYQTAVDANGTVWAADMFGMLESGNTPYDWANHVPAAPVGNDVINLALSGDSLYMNTFSEGVARFDGTTWRNWPASACSGTCDTTFASSYFTFALLPDRRGHVWVASWASSLEEFDDTVSPPTFVHHTINDPVTAGLERHTFGWAATEDGAGGHWFGLSTNGITEPIVALGMDYFDANGNFVKNFRPDSFPSMHGSEVRALLRAVTQSGTDRMFIGFGGLGSRGLQYFDRSTFPNLTFTTIPGGDNLEVIGMAQHADSIWVLTTQDVRVYSLTSLNLRSLPISKPGNAAENSLHPLDVGPDGTVWIGSEAGLRALHPGNTVTDYTVTNSPLLDNRVRAVRVDPSTGMVWVGTGGGLNTFDPGYVAPGDTIPASLSVQVYPNPVMITALGVPIRLRGSGSRYSVDVIDVRGRRVRHIDGVTNGVAFWNARDDSGNLVRPGVYFVRVETGGRTATARVALIR